MDQVLKELEAIKINQKRYEEQFLKEKCSASAVPLSVTGTSPASNQELKLQKMKEAIDRLESLVTELERQVYINSLSSMDADIV